MISGTYKKNIDARRFRFYLGSKVVTAYWKDVNHLKAGDILIFQEEKEEKLTGRVIAAQIITTKPDKLKGLLKNKENYNEVTFKIIHKPK